MKKIPTLFERDWAGDKSRVLDRVHPGCEWVIAGEGIATKKLDRMSCLVRDGQLFKRREVRPGDALPPDFELSTLDEEIGKKIGWIPVTDGPEDRWHREAFAKQPDLEDGTYELLGPKIQANAEGLRNMCWCRTTTRGDLTTHRGPSRDCGNGSRGSKPRELCSIIPMAAWRKSRNGILV